MRRVVHADEPHRDLLMDFALQITLIVAALSFTAGFFFYAGGSWVASRLFR